MEKKDSWEVYCRVEMYWVLVYNVGYLGKIGYWKQFSLSLVFERLLSY